MVLLPVVVASLLAAPPEAKAGVKVLPDVTYATLGGEKLQLDLYLPTTPGPHPCVICFHGGAWTAGSRKDLTRPALFAPGGRDANQDLGILDKLARQGFAAASVSYRLAPKHKFPAQIEDAKTAVRFLRQNAEKYHLAPDRFAALGFSAGGHLALMLGLTTKGDDLEGDLYPDVSSEVQCVIDFFGPTDMSLYSETKGLERSFMVPLLGEECLTDPTCYKRASPIEYVRKGTPPTLIIHGTLDLIVPIVHSERLVKKMREVGADVELVPVAWKGHGWTGEAVRESALASLAFLQKHLIKAEGK